MASVVKLAAQEFHGGIVQARRDNGEAILFNSLFKRVSGGCVTQNTLAAPQGIVMPG
jgi:hypothetical protein